MSEAEMTNRFRMMKPNGMTLAWATEMWAKMENDVREEFILEGIANAVDLAKEIDISDNFRIVIDMKYGRFITGFWSKWNNRGRRVFGCVVSKPTMAGDKMMFARIGNWCLDEYMKTEPKKVKESYVGIPNGFVRLLKHAERMMNIEKTAEIIKDKNGTKYTIFKKRRKSC